MELETTRENITINKLVNEKKDIITIEGDIIVPDVKPDILSTIDAQGTVCIYKKEILDGKIRFDGCISLDIIYLADSEDDFTRSLSNSLDFTQMIDMDECKTGMTIKNRTNIKDIECKVLNGRKISVKVTLDVEIAIYSNEEISILKKIENIDNVQTLNSNIRINNLVGTGNCKAIAKDTILLNEGDILGEILKTEVGITNKETKVSYNKVLLKADAIVKIMYLTDDKKTKIITSTIPIMGFIDINNVSEEDMLSCDYEIKNILIKPNINEKNSIYVEIEFEIECDAIDTIDVELIQDMYSPTNELEFTSKKVITTANKKIYKNICNIKSDISIPEISGGILYDTTVKPKLTNFNILNGKIIYEGEIEINFIFASNLDNNRIETKKYYLPFTFQMENNEINSNKNINTSINCIDDEFVIESNGIISCKISLEFELTMYDNINMSIIDKINISEKGEIQTPSMVIYIIKPGDTIWNIAKKYKTTMQKIIDTNNLEDSDNIKVGQKLFIPRYNKMQIA